MSNTDGAQGFAGFATPSRMSGAFNCETFALDQRTAQIGTLMPVKIIAVHGGGVGAAPTVDVQPLVQMVDGAGNLSAHDTVYGIQTHRHQRGNSALIVDPVKDDVGFIAIPHRDISSVLRSGTVGPPGSLRRHRMEDGIYMGNLGLGPTPNGTPTQYIHMQDNAILMHHPSGNQMQLDATGVTITGSLFVTGEIVAKSTGVDVHLSTHIHSGVVPGGGDTLAPVPGT